MLSAWLEDVVLESWLSVVYESTELVDEVLFPSVVADGVTADAVLSVPTFVVVAGVGIVDDGVAAMVEVVVGVVVVVGAVVVVVVVVTTTVVCSIFAAGEK